MTGPRSERRAPAPLGALLGEALRVGAERAGVAIDRERWRELVGARIAERSAPGRLDRGVLTVLVASAVWAQELGFLAPEILARLASGGIVVRELSFRVAQLPAVERRPRAAAPAPIRPDPPLPADLEQRLAEIADPDVRRAVTAAASASLARLSAGTPGARGPRAAARESDRRGRAEPGSRAARSRTNAGPKR